MQRTRALLSLVSTMLVVASCAPTGRDPLSPHAGDTTSVVATEYGSTTLLPTTTTTTTSTTSTEAPPTTMEPTTSTTTTLLWQAFPLAPVTPLRVGTIRTFSRVNTTDPVVFLTIDDGFFRDPRVIELLVQRQAPATLFLVSGSLAQEPDYFRRIVALGGSINTHTLRHAALPGMSYEDQRTEICGMTDQITKTVGQAGWFFRPPRGEYDSNSLAAARSCGARAMLLWRVTVSDGVINTWGTSPIHPGDIILVHFVRSTYDSLVVLFAELDRLGLTVARIEDYLPAS